MLIEYESEPVRKIFNYFDLMIKRIGEDRTRLIKKRIDQLKASKTFNIYLATGLGSPSVIRKSKRLLWGYGYR